MIEGKKMTHLDLNLRSFILFNDNNTIKLTDFGQIKKYRVLTDLTSLDLYVPIFFYPKKKKKKK